ncbi:MAG: FtsQ-type POTRA domain-containing protein [Candidatus Sericytochromatia bacterium]|nr:FtsQ-type POTRA domain-containing protein [Candidatus Sericytochromatia bacterium]
MPFALLLGFAIWWLWFGGFWRWDGLMTVTGNRLVSKQDIFNRLYIPQNTPLFLLNPHSISQQLSRVPAIENVIVQRWLFPPRLEVTIVEREAWVRVEGPPGETLARWADREGVIFAAPVARISARFSTRVWLDMQPGDRIGKSLHQFLLDLLVAWPAKSSGRVDLRREKDVYAAIGGWPVRLGSPDQAALKIALFQELRPLAETYRTRLKYINLRFPKSPTFVLKSGDEVKVEKEAEEAEKHAPATATTSPPR